MGLGRSARTKATRSGKEMRMKAKLHSQRLPDAQKAWGTFLHMLLKEQPLSDTTLKWRTSQQGTGSPVFASKEMGCVVCLACANKPYFRNAGHINEAYIPAAFFFALMQSEVMPQHYLFSSVSGGEWWPPSSDISHISSGPFWGWWSIANACCFVGLEWEMPGMPTVTVICIWLSLPGYRLAERRVCPEYLPPLWEQRGKQLWKPNLHGVNRRGICSGKYIQNTYSFIPCHTYCLFCPWAQQQQRRLFTEVIATWICACWQSIGGFDVKPWHCLFVYQWWSWMLRATFSSVLHSLNVEGHLIPFSGCDSALTLRSSLEQSCACESMWQQLFKSKASVGAQRHDAALPGLCRLFRVYRYRGSPLCLSNDLHLFLFPPWATASHDNDLIFTCVWWNQARPIEVFHLCSMICPLRTARPGGDCIIECPTCYETQHTDSGALLSFPAPASLSSHLPFSFSFPRLFMGFFFFFFHWIMILKVIVQFRFFLLEVCMCVSTPICVPVKWSSPSEGSCLTELGAI